MLRLLIVDDDYYVRKDLLNMLNWEEIGFQYPYEASNGKEALEIYDTLNPEVIITDISMPVMDGIEFIKTMEMRNSGSCIIVLSCFDDFTYVKEAMKGGAIDYILKHFLTKDLLLEVIEKARTWINEKIKLKKNSYDYKKQNVLTLPIVIDKALKQILMGLYYKESDIFDLLRIANLSLKLSKVAVLIVEIDDYRNLIKSNTEKERDLIIFSMLNIINEVLNGYSGGLASYYEIKRIAVVVELTDKHSELMHKTIIEEIANMIKECLFKFLGMRVTIGISDICLGIKNIPNNYKQALEAVNYKIYKGKFRAINFLEVKQLSSNRILFDSERENEFTNLVKSKNVEGAFYVIEKFLDEHLKNHISPDILYMDCYDLIHCIYKIINTNKLDENQILDGTEPLYMTVQRFETVEEIKKFFLKLIQSIAEKLISINGKNHRLEVLRAIDYLNENYKKDINLDTLADFVQISKSYLCVLFKEEMGEGIIDYLNRLRVQKAKQCILSNNFKIYEVAENVGIPNVKYFSKVFKDIEGVSPKDFKLKGEVVNK